MSGPETTSKLLQSIDWESWSPRHRVAVVCIHTSNTICLIHKKRGFGAGKVVLPGGKQKLNETIEACAIRECREEVGLIVSNLQHYGTLHYQFMSGYRLQLEVFATNHFSGQIFETAEALPFWSEKQNLPFDAMWPDTQLWLPQLFQTQSFKGYFLFESERILDKRMTIKATN